ncbi:MAG: PIN domain-containing protein [Bacteroidales bacterium]|nr:PIN domain-containing protein [Bacteroidales bacterium]
MGLISQLKGKKIFIDTAPFIYYIEGNVQYQKILNHLFNLNSKGEIFFSTSVLTLLELLVVPIRNKKFDLVEQYEAIFSNSNSLELIEINLTISKLAAEYRAQFNFKTPDAIQLASASFCDADFFLTNDKQLKQNKIETIVLHEVIK